MVLESLTLEEMVVWDNEIYPTILPDMVRKYGEGPFRVVGLRLWLKHKGDADIDGHTAPYAVTVELPNGERTDFAGEWFKRVA